MRNDESDDLFWFLRIAELLDRGFTQREVAAHIKKNLTFVNHVLERIKIRFPNQPLLAKGAGSGGKLELSQAGRELLNRVLGEFHAIGMKRSRLFLAASLSLVTNDVISPAIAEFLSSSTGENVQFSLRLKSEMKFANLLDDLISGRTDLAIVFGEKGRLDSVDDKRIKEVRAFETTPFDLVIITSDRQLASKIDVVIPETFTPQSANKRSPKLENSLRDLLRGRKAVWLADAQPMASVFSRDNPDRDNTTVEVDTFHSALGAIKSHSAEWSIVPAFYPVLEHARARGELYFSRPVGKLGITALHARDKPLGEPAKQLLQMFAKRLSLVTRRIGEIDEWTSLPENVSEIRSLRYAYYIDGQRTHGHLDSSDGVVNSKTSEVINPEITQSLPPYRWKWETIEWEAKKIKSNSRLTGYCSNVDNDVFSFEATRTSSAIIIEANRPKDAPLNKKSGQKFVSIFTHALKKPFRLLGVWTTIEPRLSGTYATVLSETRLNMEDLLQIQQVSYRSILSADQGVKFENQPLLRSH